MSTNLEVPPAETKSPPYEATVKLSELDDDDVVNEKIGCRFLGKTPGAMQNERRYKRPHPPYIKSGKSVLYRVGTLREWIRKHTVKTTQ